MCVCAMYGLHADILRFSRTMGWLVEGHDPTTRFYLSRDTSNSDNLLSGFIQMGGGTVKNYLRTWLRLLRESQRLPDTFTLGKSAVTADAGGGKKAFTDRARCSYPWTTTTLASTERVAGELEELFLDGLAFCGRGLAGEAVL